MSAYDAAAWLEQTFRIAVDDRAWPWEHWLPHWPMGTVAGSCYPAAGVGHVEESVPASGWLDACPPVSRALRR